MLILSTKLPQYVTILGKKYAFFHESEKYEFNRMTITGDVDWQEAFDVYREEIGGGQYKIKHATSEPGGTGWDERIILVSKQRILSIGLGAVLEELAKK